MSWLAHDEASQASQASQAYCAAFNTYYSIQRVNQKVGWRTRCGGVGGYKAPIKNSTTTKLVVVGCERGN